MSVPHIGWNSDGTAYERVYSFHECSDRENSMRGSDIHGPIYWTCQECGGCGTHQSVTKVEHVRRPEYDAPRPGSLESGAA